MTEEVGHRFSVVSPPYSFCKHHGDVDTLQNKGNKLIVVKQILTEWQYHFTEPKGITTKSEQFQMIIKFLSEESQKSITI